MEGKDYVGGTFAVRFRSGETTKLLRIPIIDDMSATEKEEVFEVEIADIDCDGAVIGRAREDFTITEKAFPELKDLTSSGLVRDCEIFANLRLKL